MTRPQILLDPVDFDALHLSALVHGGIGHSNIFLTGDIPHCKNGHARWIDPSDGVFARLYLADLTAFGQDDALIAAGVKDGEKVDFERYIELLNIDIRERA